jgi:predicted alpha/beta-fold hydrolase
VIEQDVEIGLGDGHSAFGKMHVESDSPCVVLAHGLTGHMNEHIHYLASRRLVAEGYSVVRFNFYGAQSSARRLTECTIAQHAHDLDRVLQFVRNHIDPSKVAVVGHSLGGLTALFAEEPFDALVLWDATHSEHLDVVFDNISYVDELGLYRWRQRIDHLLSPNMIEEFRALDSNALIARNSRPTLIVSVGEGDRPEAGRKQFEHANEPKQHVVIPNSDHNFTIGNSLVRLLDETVSWLHEHLV